MATLLLGAAGGALGGVFGPIGALVGQGIGGIVGSFADQMIVNAITPATRQNGPRLTTSDIQASTEGTTIDRVRGRARITGQVIWSTRFDEEVVTERNGGKGLTPKTVATTYSYFGNFAVGLCEGRIAGIGRIWADGVEIDQSLFEFRIYTGDEDQDVDPLVEAKEGEAPAYRGLAYVVFERMPLQDFGNRLPQMSMEVFRPVGDLEGSIRGVALIGGNEFGFDPALVSLDDDDDERDVNRHTLEAPSDFIASIDRLQMLAPDIASVMLVVPWFGDDLRCGHCTIRPKVDSAQKATKPYGWQVGPLTRETAEIVTFLDDAAAYGGTPSDAAVIRAIQELSGRGIAVTLCPFLMMDVAPDNSLPNPYSSNAATEGQPAFPWRGRITCSPAVGYAGSPDKTATAATQVSTFIGSATPGDFGGSGTEVTYSGPNEWSYRRFILHCAKLAALAGGVDSFLIGTEMVGLTQVRSAAAAYPFVSALKILVADVRAIVGAGVKLGYAADWSEYNSHRPADASGDLYFNLDPLWSDSHIDFVGIDNYAPLSDWRDGSAHLDFDPVNGPTTIYDAAYLDSRVEGGEAFEWYYATPYDRDLQQRLPITDGAYGKPWVYRQKDFRAWWMNAHHNRPGGIESATATDWTPQGKPLRFIEMGCPAVDKGANQPNVFVDPKSSESDYPYYSTQARDDAMQRAWLSAMIGHYAESTNNPVSTVYGGPMLDLSRSHVWCWDARPWPSFDLDGSWGDAPNWQQGHWLSGRLGTAPATETIRSVLDDCGFGAYVIDPNPAVVDGLTTGTLGSARDILDALQPIYQFDGVESGGIIRFISRLGQAPVARVAGEDLVLDDNGRRFRQTRAQETDLPQSIKLTYGDPARDDQTGSVEARRMAGGSLRTTAYGAPVIMAENVARGISEQVLHAAWTGREQAAFSLPPSFLALDPGDVVTFEPTSRLMRLSTVTDSSARAVEALRVEPLALAPVRMPRTSGRKVASIPQLSARVIFVDGPMLQDGDPDYAGYVGGIVLPVRAGLATYRSPDSSGYQLDTLLPLAAKMGVSTAEFAAGPVWRWDRLNSLQLRLIRGNLTSADERLVLNGANPLLIENANGEWELLQYATATPTGSRTFTLTNLLRGQRGTEHAMRSPVSAGARILIPDAAIASTAISPAMLGLPLNWRVGPADRDIGSSSYIDQAVTLTGKGRRPLAPVRLAASRQSSGDFALSWIRRTRIGGDSWEQAEVPLGEERESYEVEILDGAGTTVLRTISGLTAQATLYTAAMQTADFGAPQTTLKWRVYQLSATYGRGIVAGSG